MQCVRFPRNRATEQPRNRLLGRRQRDLRTTRRRAQGSIRAELPRRHAVADAELLTEIVLGVESTAARDLRDAEGSAFQQPRRFLEPLLCDKLAEQTAGGAMKTAGEVLTRVAGLFNQGLDIRF